MRLIDADALRDYFEGLPGDTIPVTDVAAVVDNWPTVMCGAARLPAAACSSSPTSENQIPRLRFSTISAAHPDDRDGSRDCGTCRYDDDRLDTDYPCIACEYLIEDDANGAPQRSLWMPANREPTAEEVAQDYLCRERFESLP